MTYRFLNEPATGWLVEFHIFTDQFQLSAYWWLTQLVHGPHAPYELQVSSLSPTSTKPCMAAPGLSK